MSLKSVSNLLPSCHQTTNNNQVLGSTADKLFSKPKLAKIEGYVGSTLTPALSPDDSYLDDISDARVAYQLEPAFVTRDASANVSNVVSFSGMLDSIQSHTDVSNFNNVFKSHTYSFDPKVDLDKLVNYLDYYWCPNLYPATTFGVGTVVASVYVDFDVASNSITFNGAKSPAFPVLVGSQYKFLINSPFELAAYCDGVLVANTENGVLTIDVSTLTGTRVKLVSPTDEKNRGLLVVTNTTNLDVTRDVLSAAHLSINGVEFTNGLIVSFDNATIPVEYRSSQYVVEGVGSAIKLVPTSLLRGTDLDYITINRGSNDCNPWSASNKWFHRSLVEHLTVEKTKAKRPIIEFTANLQLHNNGSQYLGNVDYVDVMSTDTFSTVEGSPGYYVDGVELQHGDTVIFAKDSDPRVTSTIYRVELTPLAGDSLIYTLHLAPVSTGTMGSSVNILKGNTRANSSWYVSASGWVAGQHKRSVNQPPLFELYDEHGYSYSDTVHYTSNFSGTPLFGYSKGKGKNDPVLGFPLNYRSSKTVGSYLFENFLASAVIAISDNSSAGNIPASNAFLKQNGLLTVMWKDVGQLPAKTVNQRGITHQAPPLSWTNNPFNEEITQLTVAELLDHYQSSVTIKGTKYGTKLIKSSAPLVYAAAFKDSSVNSIESARDQYSLFKRTLIELSTTLELEDYAPSESLDIILEHINANKGSRSAYSQSAMCPYGTDVITNRWKADGKTTAPLTAILDKETDPRRAILVYVDDVQLISGIDYALAPELNAIVLATPLNAVQVLTVKEFPKVTGSFIPPTPTALGLFPRSTPSLLADETNGLTFIQGHDGSLTRAFGDFRDALLLEYEIRVYNTLRVEYDRELLDVNQVIPNVWDSTQSSNTILAAEFIKWVGKNNAQFDSNVTYDERDPFTWNYRGAYCALIDKSTRGSWREVYKQVYRTDRPHTAPWEMLGFTEEPVWWTSTYGAAPYTRGNEVMWEDISNGIVRGTNSNAGYKYPGLLNYLPVDARGRLLPPGETVVSNVSLLPTNGGWEAGDSSPVELAWKRSSEWAYNVLIAFAKTQPDTFHALGFDPARLQRINGLVLSRSTNKPVSLISEQIEAAQSGYSVLMREAGVMSDEHYSAKLNALLSTAQMQLAYEAGGFVSKNHMTVLFDSWTPQSGNTGAMLPAEDYEVFLNVANSTERLNVSGFVIRRTDQGFAISGYDTSNPVFQVLIPDRIASDPYTRIGGVTEAYVNWAPSNTDTSNVTGNFYQPGQLVKYQSKFYRARVGHRSGNVFDNSMFVRLPEAPSVGGVVVQRISRYKTQSRQIPYGYQTSSIQEVYDIILGYGAWLETKGVTVSTLSTETNTAFNWEYSSREFAYWTTQSWDSGSVITLSPFSYELKVNTVNRVIGDVTQSLLLGPTGSSLPTDSFSVIRDGGELRITTNDYSAGLYFVSLVYTRVEHVCIFNNQTIFNDTIYARSTGYKHPRLKLVGVKTTNWDGSLSTPGFLQDTAIYSDWESFKHYYNGSLVRRNGTFYTSNKTVTPTGTFDYNDWDVCSAPSGSLIPNIEYVISSLSNLYDADDDLLPNDFTDRALALVAYSPRLYFNNITTNPVSQFKFYQGYIRSKGTLGAIKTLERAKFRGVSPNITVNEEWAVRVGAYGAVSTVREIETLVHGDDSQGTRLVKYLSNTDTRLPTSVIQSTSRLAAPADYIPEQTFPVSVNEFSMPTAGYVNIEDVTATAFNEASLTDIGYTRLIKDGDTIWLGFKSNGDWDVVRYTQAAWRITAYQLTVADALCYFNTNVPHKLTKGALFAVSQSSSDINRVYQVASVPTPTSIGVSKALLTISGSSSVSDGLVFEFVSARYSDADSLTTSDLPVARLGSKYWIDSIDGKWAVLEKVNNFSYREVTDKPASKYGQCVATNGAQVAIGAPAYTMDKSLGYVSFLSPTSNRLINHYLLAEEDVVSSTVLPEYGSSISGDNNLFCIGLPSASNIRYQTTNSISHISRDFQRNINYRSGAVELVEVDAVRRTVNRVALFTNATPLDNSRFGSSSAIVRINNQLSRVYVGAPGVRNQGIGAVHIYEYLDGVVTSAGQLVPVLTPSLTSGAQYGYSISRGGNRVAVSAPGINSVIVFDSVTHQQLQIISGPTASRYGAATAMSSDGTVLAVTAPELTNSNTSIGAVLLYRLINNEYVLDQTIANHTTGATNWFGTSLSLSSDGKDLVITTVGDLRVPTEFDNGTTLFDSDTTTFSGVVTNTGCAYLYRAVDTKFLFAQDINSYPVVTDARYGESAVICGSSIVVGAPGSNTAFWFDKIDPAVSSPAILRSEPLTTQVDVVRSVEIIDGNTEQLLEKLEIYDPAKGLIPRSIESEIDFITYSDPAVYSIGDDQLTVDTANSWLDQRVGTVWWDLRTTKFTWYEQGDDVKRYQNWGSTFTGSTIDVYEWVVSDLLPSAWAVRADTVAGLTQGISGQPLYPDNRAIAVKKVYNTATSSFNNQYYFWVKNRVTLPNSRTSRTLSVYQIAAALTNPTAYGIKFAAPVSANGLLLSNVNSHVRNAIVRVVLDNSYRTPKHTEWALVHSGMTTPFPVEIERKLVDSLLGRDRLRNPIPAPTLTYREKWGMGPEQTAFGDRLGAIRNLVEFVNRQLIAIPATKTLDFTYLNAVDPIPSTDSGLVDLVVNEFDNLSTINVSLTRPAVLEPVVVDGRIVSVNVLDVGAGYLTTPTVRIDGTNLHPAELTVELSASGSVARVVINNSGAGYTDCKLIVRPFSVAVGYTPTLHGWAVYQYTTKWTRVRTQLYSTPNYWDRVDWAAEQYNPYQTVKYTVTDRYQLARLTPDVGDYVKVRNPGDGNAVILERILTTELGTFSRGYNLVHAANGTIQLKNSLWDRRNSDTTYDYLHTYDQTLYDQTADIELEYIIRAVKESIFINDLKGKWSELLIQLIKFSLTEQKNLDWAFKTSFISVHARVSNLNDQFPLYREYNSDYIKQYIDEVKPFRTKIRKFVEQYDILDSMDSNATDFDFPSVSATEDAEAFTSSEWYKHHKYAISGVELTGKGWGYTTPPDVVIETRQGDTGGGATAVATINSNGQVVSVTITNTGSGYTTHPIVKFVGGNPKYLATAYPVMDNPYVRSFDTVMKFDRVTTRSNSSIYATDNFTTTTDRTKFELSWPANDNDYNDLVVTVNNVRLRPDQYTITNQLFNNRTTGVLDVLVPYGAAVNTIAVFYPKHPDVFTSVDRILMQYRPASGVIDLAALMTGVEYDKHNIQGEQFGTTDWITTDTSSSAINWESAGVRYVETQVVQPIVQGTNYVVLDTVDRLRVGDSINLLVANREQMGDILFEERIANPAVNISIIGIDPSTNTVHLSSNFIQSVSSVDQSHLLNNQPTVINTIATLEVWAVETPPLSITNTVNGGQFDGQPGIVVDGDIFINPHSGHAVEECIPGVMLDSLSLSVYTKSNSGSLSSVSGEFTAGMNFPTQLPLSVLPISKDYITVASSSTIYEFVEKPVFTAAQQYSIDWVQSRLIVAPQASDQLINYSIFSIGSTNNNSVVDNTTVTVNGTDAIVYSNSSRNSIASFYAVIDGVPSNSMSGVTATLLGNDNELTPCGVRISGMSNAPHSIKVWYFASNTQRFDEIKEQVVSANTASVALQFPPVGIEPAVVYTVVEHIDGGVRKRLLPPKVSYYQVVGTSNTFRIDNEVFWVPTSQHFNTDSSVRVYVNNRLLSNTEFTKNLFTQTVQINSVMDGDVVAIVSFPNKGYGAEYDYDVVDGVLFLYSGVTAGELRVLTLLDNDYTYMRTERFRGVSSGKYQVSREINNLNFVWVTVNGIPLASSYDFNVLDDNRTIQISSRFALTDSDDIVISCFSTANLSETVIGYNVFHDMFDKQHYTRISKFYSTQLSAQLTATDTEISVVDATALSDPDLSSKKPGVVFIGKERIEFYEKSGNTLKRVLRGTLGTSPADYYPVGAVVQDSGATQQIGFSETIYRQFHFINTSTQTTRYVFNIQESNSTIDHPAIGLVESNGIVLNSPRLGIAPNDELLVYYAGRQLKKSKHFVHDTAVRNVGVLPDINSMYQVSTAFNLPTNAVLGTVALTADTGKVWVFENSVNSTAVNGWMYSGTRVKQPEFEVNPYDRTIALNIESGIVNGVKVVIVKKDFTTAQSWNSIGNTEPNVSLIDSTTPVALFLKESPSGVPVSAVSSNSITPLAVLPAMRDLNNYFFHNGEPLTGF